MWQRAGDCCVSAGCVIDFTGFSICGRRSSACYLLSVKSLSSWVWILASILTHCFWRNCSSVKLISLNAACWKKWLKQERQRWRIWFILPRTEPPLMCLTCWRRKWQKRKPFFECKVITLRSRRGRHCSWLPAAAKQKNQQGVSRWKQTWRTILRWGAFSPNAEANGGSAS